jgi:hypothetical protein
MEVDIAILVPILGTETGTRIKMKIRNGMGTRIEMEKI